MLLHIVARGRIGRGPEAELVDRYAKRIAWPLKLTELPDQGGKVPPRDPDGVTVALDERGEQATSRELAARLERVRGSGGAGLTLCIGGADGHSDALRARADYLWSLSRLTLPHRLARVVVLEQIYRATSILAGAPYHHD